MTTIVSMMTKQVAYAYPTSITAERLGFGKTGCYFVSFLTRRRERYTCKRERGFDTLAEAFSYAEQQPERYDDFSYQPDGGGRWLPPWLPKSAATS